LNRCQKHKSPAFFFYYANLHYYTILFLCLASVAIWSQICSKI